MRRPRFRLSVRRSLALVVLIALGLTGWRIYVDGPHTHWLALKLRYGDAKARSSAATEIRQSEMLGVFNEIFSGSGIPGFGDEPTALPPWRLRRRAEMLIPVLADGVSDPDPTCRALTLKALVTLTGFRGSDFEKQQTLRLVLTASRDPNEAVRTQAVDSLGSMLIVSRPSDLGAILEALKIAINDPSVGVRRTAVQGLGILGRVQPEARRNVAPLLMHILSSGDDPSVKVKATWALCGFGADHNRLPNDEDVVPALLATLRDSEAEVRRSTARILGNTTSDAQGRRVSYWEQRKETVRHALKESLVDADMQTREEAALALYWFGERDARIIELIKQGDRTRRYPFSSALDEIRKAAEAEEAGDDMMETEP